MITAIENKQAKQSVILPKTVSFPENTTQVFIRKIGKERVISPIEQVWDSFFDDPSLKLSDDFERGEQTLQQREEF